MRIKDFWTDMYSLYIIFLTNENMQIRKLIFLPENHTEHEEIRKIIKSKFHNVNQVLSIEEWDAGLALKQSV
ncbi:hypothetical protein [Carnobacterium maltaromaticum]|uniref:hypothetical protein n=1 Tax=Carnobacterium maltaromaticum TaxID=2751 RepID=UPI0010727486|nr:hypothetical protein [Carnobacterium maltaromaticum]TFJ77761.1 hypothetical protein CKN94_00625 [Carnobacterium maltaromaticum]TFJ79826.1 hypothetical protein CKN97_00625 [Carnobacterium maltaromaticum]